MTCEFEEYIFLFCTHDDTYRSTSNKMKRRQFIQNFSLLAGGSTFSNYTPFNYKNFGSGSKNILLNAYYFRAHMYTMVPQDRKSTRLNSSHVAISYAVFCLKK